MLVLSMKLQRDLCAGGAGCGGAVCLQRLPEVLGVADRIVVMREGEIAVNCYTSRQMSVRH